MRGWGVQTTKNTKGTKDTKGTKRCKGGHVARRRRINPTAQNVSRLKPAVRTASPRRRAAHHEGHEGHEGHEEMQEDGG